MLGNALLQGEKVYLDAVRRDDLPQFTRWFGNLDLLMYLLTGSLVPKTEDDELEWFEHLRQKSNSYTFAIRLLKNDQLIGSIGLNTVEWRSRWSEVGIAVADPEYWGEGYGTDAMRIIVRYAFIELNLHRVELMVYSYNERGIGSYNKVGFKHEGTRRQAFFRDGQYHDIHVMALLQDEWLALQK